jgi:hypothetical protein
MALQSVTLNFHGHYGYLDYNEENGKITVHIEGQEAAEQAVLDFLAKPLTISVPCDEACTYHFHKVTFQANENWESCKQVLSRLWVNTGVLVEWSMPPRMVENL